MKKLMIAAAIVCAAVGLQASQFKWSFEADDTMGSYTVADNATYYLFNADSGTGAALLKTLVESGVDAFNEAIQGYAHQTGTLTGGSVNDTTFLDSVSDHAAIFIFNDGVAADKTFAYNEYDISDSIYTPPASKAVKALYASDYGDSDYASAWGTGTIAAGGDVPEPTSGLLLLLGMAGLALRRRRA